VLDSFGDFICDLPQTFGLRMQCPRVSTDLVVLIFIRGLTVVFPWSLLSIPSLVSKDLLPFLGSFKHNNKLGVELVLLIVGSIMESENESPSISNCVGKGDRVHSCFNKEIGEGWVLLDSLSSSRLVRLISSSHCWNW
jgi:hypothetical protein